MNSVFDDLARSYNKFGRDLVRAFEDAISLAAELRRAATYFRQFYRSRPMDLTTLRIRYSAWIRRELAPRRGYDRHKARPRRITEPRGYHCHQTLPRVVLTYPTYPRRVDNCSPKREERLA